MIALSDHRFLRFGAFAGLYVAQGLPWGLFTVALPTWLSAQGYSGAEVGGFFFVVTIPWSLKLVAGPVMDRFAFPAMGRRRPWVIAAQIGLLAGAIALAFVGTSLMSLMIIGFVINFFAAWQDVAVDGMAMDVLQDDERARATSFMFGGQAVGISVSSAGSAWLLHEHGLPMTALVMASLIAAIALIPLLLRERGGERLLPWTEGQALPRTLALAGDDIVTIGKDLFRVLILPMSLLLIAVKFGDRMIVGVISTAMPIVSTQELGHDTQFYPDWMAVANLVAAGFGVLIAPVVDKVGLKQALFAGISIKALILAGAGLLASMWPDERVFAGVILLVSISGQLLTIASIALFMTLCAPRVAATQFAVYMALSNLAMSTGAGTFGWLDAELSFEEIFIAVAVAEVALLGLVALLNLSAHRDRVDRDFAIPEPDAVDARAG